MKRLISILLIVCMLVTMTACTANQKENPSDTDNIKFKAGTYSEIGNGISDKPISDIPKEIISEQSLAIDAISGATITSNAIISAVEDCVKQAGVNPDALKKEKTTVKGKDETTTTDVVVVGAGASGTSAALTALQDGSKVILLEKTAFPAGAGTAAGSMFSVNSRLQKENGEEVDPQWLYDQYMLTSNYHANGALVKNIINNSSETVDWLIDNGVKLTNLPAGMQGGSEKVMKEGQSTANAYVEGGIPAISGLHELFIASGGDLRYETPAFEIIEKDGKVIGVKATKPDGGILTINAKSVIIATGGFSNNSDMVKEYFPNNNLSNRDVVGGAEGDGLKMAWSIGAGRTGIIPQNYGIMHKSE